MKAEKRTGISKKEMIQNIVHLIEKGNAHVSLESALQNIPFSVLGVIPQGLPYSIWQLAEHIRIAQWDILEFSRNAKHISPKWPDGYWPTERTPQSETAWQKCIDTIMTDRNAFVELIKNNADTLDEVFEYGDGQSLLKEALVLADHNSYHTGELIVMRRILNAWNNT